MTQETVNEVIRLQNEIDDLKTLKNILESRNDVCVSTENQLNDEYWLTEANMIRGEFKQIVNRHLAEAQKRMNEL